MWALAVGARGIACSLEHLYVCKLLSQFILLMSTLQVHWLWEHEASRVLMEEVEAETAKVWKFIIDREIEAPERFRSIQSYRCDFTPYSR